MFEKEAEYYAFDEMKHKQEWYIKHPEHSIDCDYEDIKKHWGKGAEFGYNKGRNEAKEILKGLYFIIESRIDYKNNIEIADEMWRAEQFWKGEK